MTTLREAAQMALDAFEYRYTTPEGRAAIEALRAALAQPEQEPVAWITTWNEPNDAGVELHWAKQDKGLSSKHTPLFYKPQHEWQGLTDEEIEKLFVWQEWSEDFADYEPVARAIEAKLKEKNT